MITHIASILLAGVLFGPVVSDSTEGVHFRVFRGDGTKAMLEDIIGTAAAMDVVFVGESHDDPIAHYLEARILELLHKTYGDERPVTLSMEMFERDVQYVVDEYLADLISEDQFRKSARTWPNYETDYRPSVEYARDNGLDVVAANAPRRYVNRVSRLGRSSLDALPPYVSGMLPPLPYGRASSAYTEQWFQTMREAMEEMRADMAAKKDSASDGEATGMPPPDHREDDEVSEESEESEAHEAMQKEMPAEEDAPSMGHGSMDNMLDSQSLWDATMAHSVARRLMDRPGSLLLHLVGSFHVEKGTGIPEHVESYRPGTRALIVTVVAVEDIESFDPTEHTNLGDFVILTDETLPRTRKDM